MKNIERDQMMQKVSNVVFLFFLPLLFQTSSAQEIHLENHLGYLTPKIRIIEDHCNHVNDFRYFDDSFIKANADQNADMRITGSSTLLGPVKLPATTKNILTNGLNLVADSATGNMGVGSALTGPKTSGVIVFSSGAIVSGATVLPTSPRLLGFGSSAAETINGSGESTVPSEAGGFSFPVPFNGTISNLQVSTDLFAVSISLLNATGLRYDFTVFVSPSTPNTGTDHVASSYVTTALTAPTSFGGLAGTTILAATYRSSTNINTGSIAVSAGSRVGVRVRMLSSGLALTDTLIAAQVAQISFAACLRYTPN
jgi:hypothetical protein